MTFLRNLKMITKAFRPQIAFIYQKKFLKKTTEDVLWNIKNSEKSHNVKKLTGSRFSETENVSEKRCIAEDKQTVYFIML